MDHGHQSCKSARSTLPLNFHWFRNVSQLSVKMVAADLSIFKETILALNQTSGKKSFTVHFLHNCSIFVSHISIDINTSVSAPWTKLALAARRKKTLYCQGFQRCFLTCSLIKGFKLNTKAGCYADGSFLRCLYSFLLFMRCTRRATAFSSSNFCAASTIALPAPSGVWASLLGFMLSPALSCSVFL